MGLVRVDGHDGLRGMRRQVQESRDAIPCQTAFPNARVGRIEGEKIVVLVAVPQDEQLAIGAQPPADDGTLVNAKDWLGSGQIPELAASGSFTIEHQQAPGTKTGRHWLTEF